MITTASKYNQALDTLILVMILGITFIDTVNGPLVTQEWFSISKPYKFSILIFMLVRLITWNKIHFTHTLIFFAFSSFFIGYVASFIMDKDILLFAANFIESLKYFIWPISFVYFAKLFQQNPSVSSFIFKIILISYLVLVGNIFLGILGFGYQFYPNYDTGVKGFFYSGNEFSLLFILLTFCLAWKAFFKGSPFYYAFMIFSLFLGFTIGSKTTIIGVVGIFFIVLISNANFSLSRVRPKRLLLYGSLFLLLPITGIIFIKANKTYFDDFIFRRLEIYEYDLLTWFLSQRNLIAAEGFRVFGDMSAFAKLFGEGEATFQKGFDIIEIDFLDLVFNHGYIGFILFFALILRIFLTIIGRTKGDNYGIGVRYLFVMVIFFLANLSGHIINTGVPGFFLGMIFATCFLPKTFILNSIKK